MKNRLKNAEPLRIILTLLVLLLTPGFLSQPAFASPKEQLEMMELALFGAKFSEDTPEVRASRIEAHLGQVSLPSTSLQYRVDYLSALNHEALTEQAHHEAIGFYNRGIDVAKAGNLQEAVTLYEEALQADPKFLEASNNLASLLEQQQEYDKALAVYEKAIRYHPDQPFIYRNQGIVLEKTGNIEKAMAAFKQYLKLSPDPEPSIAALVRIYDEGRKTGLDQDNYLSLIRRDNPALLWPEQMNPIPVFVELTGPQDVLMMPCVEAAFLAWEHGTQYRLRFKQTSNARKAGITLRFLPGPLIHPVVHVGRTMFRLEPEAAGRNPSLHVSITVNTGEPESRKPLKYRQEQVKRLILHELGHAIGLWGHSPNVEDIMYSHPMATQLSQRDINTVLKLYGQQAAK